ncbi:MAG: hypothetical protein RR448_00555 [Niameybacter sp.]
MIICLEVDKSFAKLQDEINYSITIRNEEQKIDSLRIVNPFDEVITFKWVNMKEILYNDSKIVTEGFLIKNLQSWEEIKVTFVGEVIDFPRENLITQMADVYYNVGKEAYVLTSNAVMTYIVDANIAYRAGSFVLQGNKGAVNRGEDITYSVSIANKGNRKAEQILVGPLAPHGTYLIPDTIKSLEGKTTLVEEGNMYIEALDIGEMRTYSYTVKVEDFPCVKEVTQALHIQYRLTYPNRQCVVQESTTNAVEIPIEMVYFTGKQEPLRKCVSSEFATEGDELTYTFEGCNVGTVSACNIQVIDTVPEGARWIQDSLLINGQNGYKMQEEPGEQSRQIQIALPDCSPGEVFSISYKVEVLGEWPLNEVLQTMPKMTYWYGVAEHMVEEEVYVQAEPTQVILACIDPLERHLIEGLEEVFTLGDTITTHLSFMNKGNVPANNIEIVLDVPVGVVVSGEGWLQEGEKVSKCCDASLEPQASYTEDLCVEIIAIPLPSQAFINAQVIYTYNVGEEHIEQVSAQEVLPLVIEAACISEEWDDINKCFYPEEVCVGEEVVCTFTLTNTGNLPAYDITIQEEAVEGLCFLKEYADELYIEKLQPKETQTVTYKAQVIGLPPDGMLSPRSQLTYHYTTHTNKCYTKEISFKGQGIQVVDAYISPFIQQKCVQQVESYYYAKGDVVHYALAIANLGNVSAENIVLVLPELQEATWRNNNPMVLNQLMPGEQQVLDYYMDVTHIPSQGIIKVAPLLGYTFMINNYKSNKSRQIERSYALDSIEVAIHYACIEEANGLTRSVETTITPLHEVVYYTVNLKNVGNVKALDVRLQESASETCIYERGTLTLNGIAIDNNPLKEAILLGTVEPGEAYSIRYGVKVSEIPVSGYFDTRSIVTYAYNVGTCIRKQKTVTEPISVQVADAALQLVTGVGGYNLTEQNIDLEESFNFDVTICARGNEEAYNLYYCIEGDGVSFESDFGLRPMQIPTVLPNQTRVISAIGKVKQFVLDGKLCIRGKLCYEFGSGMYRRQHTLYTEEQKLYIYAAGPLTPEAFKLEMSHKVVHVGEKVTLTLWLTGEGNCPMEQTMIYLKGFEKLGFQVEEVYSEQESILFRSIEEAFCLGTIYPQQKKHITIEGFMTHISKETMCEYEGMLTYQYISATSSMPKKVCCPTLKGNFIFKESGLSQEGSITLRGDKTSLRQNETIVYSLKIANKGNAKTEGIKIQLMIDERLEIEAIPDHVKGGAYTGELISGIYIEKLRIDEEIEIKFRGLLKTLVTKEDLAVSGTVIYEYEDGEEVLKVCEKEIPPYFVTIESADFEGEYFSLIVDKKEVDEGKTVHCQIHCQNGGNKQAKGVKVQVMLPIGFTYVQKPFYSKNKINKNGTIEIGTLQPMEKRLIEVDLVASQLTREYQENDRVQGNCISARLTYKEREEEVEIQALPIPLACTCPLLEMNWELDTEKAIVGELVQYRLYIHNKGNRKAEAVTISDLLPEEVRYVTGSLRVEGMQVEFESLKEQGSTYEEERARGFLQLGDIEQKEKIVLICTGQIERMPLDRKIEHKTKVTYQYLLNNQIEEGLVESKRSKLEVETAQLEIFKQCNKQKMNVGGEVEVSVKLINTGSMPLDQIIFYDALPEGLLFVEGSFKRGGKRQGIVDLGTGVGLGALKLQEQCILSYKLRVSNYTGTQLEHSVYADYLFNQANFKINKKRSEVLVDRLELISPYQVLLNYETQIFLSYDAPDLYEILNIEVEAEILEAYCVSDHPSEAEIKGILNYDITYRGKDGNRQIKVKKVWNKCIELSYEKSKERLQLQVMTKNIEYVIVHKRALKVEVGLNVSET